MTSSRVRAMPGIAFHVDAVAFEVRHERGVDDVVLERVHEHRRHEPAVLADLVQLGVGGAGEARCP